MQRTCKLLGFNSRQTFYKQVKKNNLYKDNEKKIIQLSNQLRIDKPCTGTKKLYLDMIPFLIKKNIKMGRDKVHKVLKDNDLIIKKMKNYKTTTNSKHYFRKYKNLIKNLDIQWPEKVFVTDITYIKVNNKFAYLFIVTDAYSKKIMGWTINYTMKVNDAKKAISMANKNRRFKNELIHHSDRGIQYCSPSYTKYIISLGMNPSMTEEAHVYENAIAERINGILKSEFGIGLGFNNLKEARAVIQKSIHTYNNTRRHMSLQYLTPNFVHLNPGIKCKKWKSKRKYNKTINSNS